MSPRATDVDTDLTSERLRSLFIYNPESGTFTRRVRLGHFAAGTVAGYHVCGYCRIEIDGRAYQASRLAWLYMTGAWPKDEVDHEDLDKGNNRWGNLREATRALNNSNVRPRNKIGLKGVSKSPVRRAKPYQAIIRINRKNRYLGYFKTAEEAHMAYVTAARAARGEFARAA